MNEPKDDRHPVAVAIEWVSRITTVAVEMVVLIWLGTWLDGKFGTRYWTAIGAVLGPVVGFWHLLVLTGVVGRAPRKDGSDRDHRK